MTTSSRILQASQEYFFPMPKRKERMAGYIRESDPSLADSTTIESQAKLVRQYGEKEGYIYEPHYEFKEAISAYMTSYMQRPQLLKMLRAAERHEFDVLVVSEVRAISRRQVEVLIIYDMLQKWGVRLETVKEKFADDAMGKAVLGLRAMFVEIEREQSFLRMQRGKADRIEIGKAPNGHRPAYGYILVDTKEEIKGRYELDNTIIFTNEEKQWSRVDVCLFIFELLQRGQSLHRTATILNDMGIPTPRYGKRWTPGVLHRIVTNPLYAGEAYANKYKQVEKRTSKNGKTINVLVKRPQEEWIRLPDAPALISKETFTAVQQQLSLNKEESVRNNKQQALGLLRAGYIFCGICKKRMSVNYPSANSTETARYKCDAHLGGNFGIELNHRTQIRLPIIEKAAKEKIVEVLLHPEIIREKVAELREKNKPVFNENHLKETLAAIRRSMQNLYRLAEQATEDETIATLTQRMNSLEKQKRDIELLLCDFAEDQEKREALEEELQRFEAWVDEVRPSLTDPEGLEKASYDELRTAIRILGLQVIVYPTKGNWPYRYRIDITVPKILAKLDCVAMQPCIKNPPLACARSAGGYSMDILMLHEEDVQNLLDPDSLLDVLAEGFKSLSEGKVVAPRRNELRIAEAGFVLGMPAWQPLSDATIKLVSVFHANSQLGLPVHQALICLFDAQTGTPLSIMDGTSITAVRTAGAAALSARLLARSNAQVLAILGAGVQGSAHLKMLPRVRDFGEIRIASRNFSHAQQLAATAPQAHPVASFEEATRGADVICLCSSSSTPLISSAWLSPGTHVTSVGYAPPGGELDRSVIAQGRVFVETRLAFEPPPVGCSELTGLNPNTGAELGEVLLGQRPGRLTDHDITVYKAMGHAMEDMVTANLVYQRARQQGIGRLVRL